MNRLWLIVLSIFLFASCKQVEVGKMQAFNVKGFSGNSLTVDLQFEVFNQRMLPVTIKQSEFSLLIGDRELGVATLQKAIKLNPNTLDSYYFPVELNLSKDITSYFSIFKILRKSNETILLKGWLMVQTGPFKKKMNFEKEIKKDEIPFL